jgi:hypothetical protein
MYLLHINAQSDGGIFEVLPEEVEHAELMVEDAVGHVLLDLVGEATMDDVTMDDVTICFKSASRTGQRECSIQIQAQCSFDSFTLLPCTKEHMERAVEKQLCSLLRELFGPMTIDSVFARPSYMESR